ncbi:DUF7127 family protein [Halopiger thermotolerans]
MRLTEFLRTADRRGAVVRTYDYDDGEHLIVVDFGHATDDIEIDTVGDTAIVVVGDRQLEFDLPADVSEISIKNGVLTIAE